MSTITFSPALAQETRPEYADDLFEPASCTSLLWLPRSDERPSASLTCSLDADHRHDPYDKRHGSGPTRWTDAQAREHLADFGPRPVRMCDNGCPRGAAIGGVCLACRDAEAVADDRAEVEA